MSISRPGEQHPPAGFQTTQWNMVLQAGRSPSAAAEEALSQLCELYWYPLYVYARRRTGDAHLAQDLTQEFFARLLEKNTLAAATPERGRFRAFLLTAFQHFMSNQWDKARASKRGGGRMALDFCAMEQRFGPLASPALTAEQSYERQWAATLLNSILDRLRSEAQDAGRLTQFERLKHFLAEPSADDSYARAAADLAVTPGAIKVAVHRLRQQYRRLLREQIAQTVSSPGEVDDEIRYLFQCLTS